MAVGAFIVLGALIAWTIGKPRIEPVRPLTVTPLLIAGLALGLGVLTSLLHLGRPLQAYRALFHLRTSWLSREILLVGLFGAGWAVFYGLILAFPANSSLLWLVFGLSTLVGLTLIFCMARVYNLQSTPTWNGPLTTATFYLTAGLLGVLFSAALLAPDIGPDLILFLHIPGRPLPLYYSRTASGLLMAVGLLMLAFDLALQGRHEKSKGKGFWPTQLRLALSVAAMLPLGIVLAGASKGTVPGFLALAFGLALGAQITGRWLFYERLNEREL
jgi:anaerobic dimethyl sulfoxide reductase subunit C